jgi:hypothetical protein
MALQDLMCCRDAYGVAQLCTSARRLRMQQLQLLPGNNLMKLSLNCNNTSNEHGVEQARFARNLPMPIACSSRLQTLPLAIIHFGEPSQF